MGEGCIGGDCMGEGCIGRNCMNGGCGDQTGKIGGHRGKGHCISRGGYYTGEIGL
jgi:hypothetical protein